MNISIALATHNGSTYLREQIESLLRQTLPPSEIIISDDGSTDTTCDLINQYSNDHKNIRLIHSQNRGINANFQNALLACRGEYIALCDQDDVWAENKLAQLASRCTAKTLLLYGKSILIDYKGNQLPLAAEEYLGFHDFRAGHIPLYFLFSNCISGHAMMISKKLIDHALPFPANCIYDHWLALIASIQSDIIHVPDAITYHRIHSENSNNNQKKNSTEKKARRKSSKIEKYTRQQSGLVLRLKKELSEGSTLTLIERDYLTGLLHLTGTNEKHFFSFQLFFRLWQKRSELFHGNPLRECRNRSLGRKYFQLLDSFSKKNNTKKNQKELI